METAPSRVATPPHSGRWALMVYLCLAWLSALSITIQVFLAGINVFLPPNWWNVHVQFGHAIGALILTLIVFAFVARLPRSLCWLSALMLVLYALQYQFWRISSLFGIPQLAALHAVNALLLFWLATTLTRSAWNIVRD